MAQKTWWQALKTITTERHELAARLDRIDAYNNELNRLELVPQAEDYNALLDLSCGAPLVLPTPKGR